MKWFISFGILVLIAVGYFANFIEKPVTIKSQVFQQQPQEYMHNAVIRQFTETGTLKSLVSAKFWGYLPTEKGSVLIAPHLIVYRPDKTVWHIDAEKGRTLQPKLGNIEEVELEGSVVIKRPLQGVVTPITLTTSILRYIPKKEYVETEAEITMIKPDITITGKGLRAYLDQGKVELLNNVKTYIRTTS